VYTAEIFRISCAGVARI
jgi:hypothetical protein